jgi:hypothetical protein
MNWEAIVWSISLVPSVGALATRWASNAPSAIKRNGYGNVKMLKRRNASVKSKPDGGEHLARRLRDV